MVMQTYTSQFDVDAWLNTPLADNSGLFRKDRLCYLIYANGGFDVHGWGMTSFDGIHTRGLEQDEALELIQCKAYIDGLFDGGIDVLAVLESYFKSYVEKYNDIYQERQKQSNSAVENNETTTTKFQVET